ncbi:hypothetical protein ACRQ5Q_22350 [Bradyrhizobium sp. PMVTL-01]|uniref:hypothetical protein n=1 Tax=Bradyrhizobium sp. PMVTL-01 TaxID=3434999 RepID=UPI003F725977
MHYRDFMQKYRPLWSPGDPAAPAAATEVVAAAAGDSGQAAPAASAGPSAEPAAAAPTGDAAPAAPAGGEAAPVAGDAPKAEPSLLESAAAKPAEAAKAEGEAKNEPAPEEPAKPEGDKKPEGDAKEAKADDKPKAEGDKADDTDPAKKEATAEAPPAPIKYDAFKVPDGIKLDDQRVSAFTEIAGKAQVPQDVAQSLLDLHVTEMQRMQTEIQQAADQRQRDVWNTLNDTWKTDARKEFGNRIDTALSRGKAVLEEYGGSPEQVAELIAHTSSNGMGNFPGFLRFLDNIATALNIFEDSAVVSNPAAPKAGGSRGERWYPSMNGGTPKA